ncbi:oligosaccharide flippase family protein [Methylococcaceae bacterium WWC4]|nr:oligosaccharide flippase family protein [Methylococcaceae bacterium WWC4]
MIDKKFKLDTLVSYATQAGVITCGFAFTTLVTQYAGIGVFGMLGLLTAFSSVLTNLMTFRTNEAVVVFYKRGKNTDDWGLCKFALAAGIALDIAVGSALLCLVYYSADTIAEYLLKDHHHADAVRLFAFALFFQFFRGAPTGYLIARERFVVFNLLGLSEHLLKLSLLGAVIWRGETVTFEHIVNALMSAAMATSLAIYSHLCWTLFMRYRRVSTKLNFSLIREYLGFSMNTFLSTALKAGNQNIDTLVLGWVAENRLVGIYTLFRQFLAPLAFLSNPFATLAYPKFVQAVVESRHADIRNSIRQVNRKLTKVYLLAIPLSSLALFGYASWLKLPMNSSQYLPFAMMCMQYYVTGILWWTRSFANAVDPNISLKGNFYATILAIILVYPASTRFDITGTAGAMLAIILVLNVYWSKKLLDHTRSQE